MIILLKSHYYADHPLVSLSYRFYTSKDLFICIYAPMLAMVYHTTAQQHITMNTTVTYEAPHTLQVLSVCSLSISKSFFINLYLCFK